MPAGAADAPAARAGRGRILPRRRPRTDPGRRARDRRHPPAAGSAGRRRPLPRRPAASPRRGAPAAAAAARTPRRHAAAGRSASSPPPRASCGAPAKRFARRRCKRLRAHDWPGNVRELENLCWRLAALAPGDSDHRWPTWTTRCRCADRRRCRRPTGRRRWPAGRREQLAARRRRTSTRRRARASTRSCSTPRSRTPTAIAARPRRALGPGPQHRDPQARRGAQAQLDDRDRLHRA